MTTPAIAALRLWTSQWSEAPRIVSVSRRPAAALQPHVFGPHAVSNLVIGEAPVLIAPGEERSFASEAEGLEAVAGDGLILRFVDPHTLSRVAAVPGAIEGARMVWLQLRDPQAREVAAAMLAERGFTERFDSPLPPGTWLSREPIRLDAPPDYAVPRRMDRLVILDNNLTGERGHYLSVATRIGEGAQEAGAAVIWAANRRLAPDLVPAGTLLDPAFATSIFDIAQDMQAWHDISDEIADAVRGIVSRHDAPGTHFLVPTTDGHFIRAFHRLLDDGWMPAGTIHLTTPYETRHMPSRHGGREIDWHLRAIAGHPACGRQLFLWAETCALATLLTARLDVPVRPLPLPAPAWAVTETRDRAGEGPGVDAARPFTIVFLGEARVDKGALELPDIARALIAGGAPGAVRVAVQRVEPFGGFNEPLGLAMEDLAAIPGVVTIDGPLDEAGYHAALTGADAVLLPYRPENYRYRGTGILIEALAAGRIVLASAGTVAAEHAGEGAVHLCGDTADWTETMQAILADRDAARDAAARAGARFRARHAPRAYADRLALAAEWAGG